MKFAEHSCGDCKLKCIDCDAQICPKCMVQCPVGNRCKDCSKRFTSHVLQVDPWVIIRALLAGVVTGLLFCILQTILPLGGIYILFFVYLFGTFVGSILFKITGRKIGPKIASTITAGILLGSFLFSFSWNVLSGTLFNNLTSMPTNITSYQQALQSNNDDTATNNVDNGENAQAIADTTVDLKPQQNSDIEKVIARNKMRALKAIYSPTPVSLSLIIFLLGVVSPFLGWNTFMPSFFRRW